MGNQSRSFLKLQENNSRKVVDFMSEQAVRQIELKQICFIDDSKTSAYVTKKLLKQQGFAVDHFPDAESALEALMENEYDLVITDLMISADGGVNGDDLIRLIRHSGHPTKSIIPIMVVTGANDTAIFNDLINAGANKVLPKPLDGESLQAAINALIPKMTHFGPADNLSLAEKNNSDKQEESTDSELMDLDLEVQYDDIITDSILPDLDIPQKNYDAQGKSKRSVKSTTKSSTARNQKSAKKSIEDQLTNKPKSNPKPKSKIKSEPEIEIPVLTSVVPANIEPEQTPVEKNSNQAITEQIEKLVEQEPTAKISKSELQLSDIDSLSKPVKQVKSSTKAKPTFGSFETLEIHNPNANINKSDEISQNMMQSIQNELTHIDERVAEKSSPETPESIHSTPSITTSSVDATVTPQTVAKTVTKPEIQESTVKQDNVFAEKPNKAPKAEQKTEDENPLLALLSHMDDPELDGDFNTKKKPKTKSVSIKTEAVISKSVWIILVLAMIIPAGIFWYLGQQSVDVKVVEVRQIPIHSEISVPGRIVSKRNIEVSARAAGQIVEVKVKEGDRVKKGQTMARMDDKEAKSNVKRAQARLMSSQEDVAATAKTQERLQRALDLGAVARQIVEDAEAAWKSASARQSEIEEELISAELKLDRLQIKAPFSGLITSVSVQEGQWLSVAEEILTLVDMDQRVVEIRVDVSDSARLNIGQEVVLSSEAFSGQSWKEKIIKIGEEAKTEDSVNVIKVQTSLGSKAPKLRIGQQVDAEIRVASRNNALTLPHNVLFTHNGSPHAAVVENGKIVFLPVVTGIESVTHVEIIRGLRAEQEIIIPSGSPLEEGMNAVATNSKFNPG